MFQETIKNGEKGRIITDNSKVIVTETAEGHLSVWVRSDFKYVTVYATTDQEDADFAVSLMEKKNGMRVNRWLL